MSFRPVNDRSSQPGLGDNRPSVSSPSPLINTSRAPVAHALDHHRASANPVASQPLRKQPSAHSDSQATNRSSNSTDSNRVFTPTPPAIERPASTGAASSGQDSSQESHLLQLSQLAAAREKMPNVGPRSSVKRPADGAVKTVRTSPPASPNRASSHSRNVSGVSVASTTSSRMTDLSSELRARMSYAMLKVNHGWQSRTIDEVETLTSRAGSPTSSVSTALAGRAQSSTSPKVRTTQHATPPSSYQHPASSRPADQHMRGTSASPAMQSPAARPQKSPALAPPVAIQPHHSDAHSRRSSDPKFTPSYLAPRSHHASPHASATPSLHVTPNAHLRNAAHPMATSPTHSKSEKEAMEALMSLSSPGASANMKVYQPGSQPMSNLRNGATSAPSTQRKALPTSAPKRKGLPNGRPTHSSQPVPVTHSPQKRVGFVRSHTNPSDMMDLDPPASARLNPAPLARVGNGTFSRSKPAQASQGRFNDARHIHRRPPLDVEHLDNILDRMVAAGDSSSDSEGEIMLPVRR